MGGWGCAKGHDPASEEAERRLREVWDSYHEQVARHRRDLVTPCQPSAHLSLHSFPFDDHHTPGRPPMPFEIELGDQHGRTGGHLLGALALEFSNAGLSVGVNETFAGGEVIRAAAEDGVELDTVQLEIRRDLYLDDGARLNWNRTQRLRTLLMSVIGRAVRRVAAQRPSATHRAAT